MSLENRRDTKETREDLFDRPVSKTPTKKRRPKQTMTREIEEAFEDEVAIEEMRNAPSFWDADDDMEEIGPG